MPFPLDARVSAPDERGEMLCILREVRGRDLLDESRRYLDVSFESAPIRMALFNTDGEYERATGTLLRTGLLLLGGRDAPSLDQCAGAPADRGAVLGAGGCDHVGDLPSPGPQ